MRITVDHDVCEANAVCEGISAELFHVRDDDVLQIKKPKPDTEELQHRAREAVRLCPKAALSIVE